MVSAHPELHDLAEILNRALQGGGLRGDDARAHHERKRKRRQHVAKRRDLELDIRDELQSVAGLRHQPRLHIVRQQLAGAAPPEESRQDGGKIGEQHHHDQHLARAASDARNRRRDKPQDEQRHDELQHLRKEHVERLENPHAEDGQHIPERHAAENRDDNLSEKPKLDFLHSW